MTEVTGPGEDHRGTRGVGRGDHLTVALRAAGLHEGGHPSLGAYLERVGEREERVRGADSAVGSRHAGLLDSQPGTVDAAHLARADAHNRPAFHVGAGENDRVRLDVATCAPREIKCLALVVRR